MSGKTETRNTQADLTEALPRLAKALETVLVDSQVHVLSDDRLSVRFDGLPNWKFDVSRHQFVQRKSSTAPIEQSQMVETSLDVKPLCIASLSKAELQRLAARENFGLCGVTVVPILADAANGGRAGLRVRAAFVAQTGKTNDEVENLAIDILTVLNFARTLEDRLTSDTVAGEFSFELYNARFENPTSPRPLRFLTTGQQVFEGSRDRVFAEVLKAFHARSIHKINVVSERNATLTWSATKTSVPLQIHARIPNDIPIFVVQAPVAKLSDLEPQQRWDIVEKLNSVCDIGHFAMDPEDFTLSFTSWKHLTNDLRAFSFDHALSSIHRAIQMASESVSDTISGTLSAALDQVVEGVSDSVSGTGSTSAQVIEFPTAQSSDLFKNAA